MYKNRILTHLKKIDYPITNLMQKVPIVELSGQTRVFIENYLGIAAYSQEEIQLKMQYGKLIIKGNSLNLLQFGKEQLVISGTVDSLQIVGR